MTVVSEQVMHIKAALRQHGAKHSLFYAADEGLLELVAGLIKEGADVNEQDEEEWTPLHYAAINDRPEAAKLIAKILLAHGADVNARNKAVNTPLTLTRIYAAIDDRPEDYGDDMEAAAQRPRLGPILQ
jgi:ankyrin repeat protein